MDDDDTFRNVLSRELRAGGLKVDTRNRGEDVEQALMESDYDVVVLDLHLGGVDGVDVLGRIKTCRPLTEVIILTGHGSVESAVQTLKMGAYDFLTKPCELDHLEAAIRRAAQARAMRSENAALRRALNRYNPSAEIIGRSPAIRGVRGLVEKVASTNASVLLRGESGTGKEVVARAIRARSPRHDRPFLVLDCGATPESLALSELFGHERGSYTGAVSTKHGLFELADSGTILIDEVGDAPANLQTHLLRVLETGTFHRIGNEESIRVDVRILAATHRDLETRVQDGQFRQDLYYRLNVLTIDVPPLRDRSEDIPIFLDHFLTLLAPGNTPIVDPAAAAALNRYAWPGNVRELRNVVERALILSGGGTITIDHLPSNLAKGGNPFEEGLSDTPPSLQDMEQRYLRSLLERFGGNRARVASALGISERTLYRKLRD